MGNSRLRGGLGDFLKQVIGLDGDGARALMRQLMADGAIAEARQLGQFLVGLASGRVPAIVHCTAGKDRTGLATAVLLTLLGVPKDQVYTDYLKSNVLGQVKLPMVLRVLRKDVLEALMAADASYLDAAFVAIEERFGDFDRYRAEALALSDAQVETLRRLLAE